MMMMKEERWRVTRLQIETKGILMLWTTWSITSIQEIDWRCWIREDCNTGWMCLPRSSRECNSSQLWDCKITMRCTRRSTRCFSSNVKICTKGIKIRWLLRTFSIMKFKSKISKFKLVKTLIIYLNEMNVSTVQG